MKIAIPILILFLSPFLAAQDDVIALSPFVVESGDTDSRSRVYNDYPDAPITLRKPADSVTLSIFLTNSSKRAAERNDEIMDTVTRIIESAEAAEGIRAHNGKISLSTRNSKVTFFSTTNESSEVRIYVLGDLAEGQDVFEKTSELKVFLEGIEPVGETEIEQGNIGLSIKNPQTYRPEILKLILEDINAIKKHLGGRVEMTINGLDGAVVVKQANESEVDLLIPYSFRLNHSTNHKSDD